MNNLSKVSDNGNNGLFAAITVDFDGTQYPILIALGDGEPEICFDGVSACNAELLEAAAELGISRMSLSRALLDLYNSDEPQPARKQAARAMGSSKSAAKQAAARANGAKGGRPATFQKLSYKDLDADWGLLRVSFYGKTYNVLVALGDDEDEICFDGLSEGNALIRDAAAAKGLGVNTLCSKLLALLD